MKTMRWAASARIRSASARSTLTTRRDAPAPLMSGPSAAVAQPDEQLARRERDAQRLLEEPVHEREGGEAQADADPPALARGAQIEHGRDERGEREAEE